MDLFPNIDLIAQPDNQAALRQLSPTAVAGVDTLVVYDADYDFLARVLNAAGYDDPKLQLQLLEWTPERGGLHLAGIVRRLGVRRVLLFGQNVASLGLHLQVVDYFPVNIAGVTYLVAPSVTTIAEAKANGNNRPAAGLWAGVKAAFMRLEG